MDSLVAFQCLACALVQAIHCRPLTTAL